MWSPLQKYTVQQFRRGMLLQLINIVLCTLSLIFNNTYFLVALVFTCNTWWLLRWRRYCGLLFPLLSYPLASMPPCLTTSSRPSPLFLG